jgi:hypothetical protein
VRRIDLRRDEGVAMTEFALILPVFVLIIVGLLAFGRVFFYWIEANHQASETARWAVVDRNPYGPGQTLQQHAAQNSTTEFAGDVKVCIDFPAGAAALGEPLRVRVQKPFNFLPMIPIGQITIRGSSTMRVENFLGTGGTPLNYKTGAVAGGDVGTCT